MKQKMVIRVQMNDEKERAKALKIAVAPLGVELVSLDGKDKNQIMVVGEGVDVVDLIKILRKKMGFAQLVSVAVVEEKKQDKKDEGKKNPGGSGAAAQTVSFPPAQYLYEIQERNYNDPCSII